LQPKPSNKKLFKNKQIGHALKVKCHEKGKQWPNPTVTAATSLNLSIECVNTMAKDNRHEGSTREKCKVRL